MQTDLYSYRKCLLFSCTICKRTLCAFFTIVFIIVFLFIEHSSMSVKQCFFFVFVSSLNKRNLLLEGGLSERTVFHVLGNREIQTNIDKLFIHNHLCDHPHYHICIFFQICTFYSDSTLVHECHCHANTKPIFVSHLFLLLFVKSRQIIWVFQQFHTKPKF